MTTYALRREPESIELTNGTDLMTGVTVNCGVGANEREAILMLIDVVNGNLPAVAVVAEFALGSILPAMKICVAVLALIRGTCEVEVGMAVATRHGCVAPPQREPCLGMIELDLAGEHLPILLGVTSLARNIELAMQAAGGRDGLTRLHS